MAGNLTQCGIGAEVGAYGTAVAPTVWYEITKEDIAGNYDRVQAEGLSSGLYDRADRFVVTDKGAAGTLDLEVLTKGFGNLLVYMMGKVHTTGPTDVTAYTHLATPYSMWGKSFTCQIGRSQEDSTVKPWTYEGGKVTGFTISNSSEKLLTASLECDFEKESCADAPAGVYVLGTPSLPTSAEVMSWQGATITLAGGAAIDVSDISFKIDNGLNADRWMLHKGVNKRQPVEDGKRKASFDFTLPYSDTTYWKKVSSTTPAGAYGSLVAKWEGNTMIAGGASTYPSLTVTMPLARFDSGGPNVDGPGMLDQKFSGTALMDGSNNAVELAYVSADVSVLQSS